MNKLYLLFLFLTLSQTFFAQGTWKTVTVGPGFSVALHSEGTLWSWGVNNFAQLGIGTASFNGGPGLAYNNVPVQVETPYQDWIAVDCAEAYTVAIRANGTIWGWGCKKNVNASNPELVYTPEQIGEDSNFVSVSAGYNFYAAIKADGTLWTWGANNFGQLGLNDTTSWVETPTQVGSSSSWKQVSCGTRHALGLDSAGHMYFWGQSSWGANSGTIQNTPIIYDPFLYQYVCAGNNTSAAIHINGSLWVWGFNYSGFLGFGDNYDRSVPTQLGFDYDWSKIYNGSTFFLGLKNDKTLWGWGYNGDGQFGNGNLGNITSPTLISLNGATYDQVAVVSGPSFFDGPDLPFGYHTLCLTANKLSICSAGLNHWGYLGVGNFNESPNFNCSVFTLVAVDEAPSIDLSVFPNPSSGKFIIEAPFEAGQAIQLFNLNGQLVYTQMLINSGFSQTLDIELNPGIYLFKLLNQEGEKLATQRLVVN
jgi:alpha-tubulin suppressor-like RCC1 family protein